MNTKQQLLEQLKEVNRREHKGIDQRISDMVDIFIKRRKSLGISQKEMAEMIGISQTSISQIETKTKVPALKNILKICIALDLNIKIE